MPPNNADMIALAQMIYGEGASEDFDTMVMMGSSALNRLEAERAEEFGANLTEVLQKGYYAVSKQNVPYKQALEGKFPDKLSENKWKQALQISSGLIKGTIERKKGQFYFTNKEIKKLKRKKAFDFKQVEEYEPIGQYRVFGY